MLNWKEIVQNYIIKHSNRIKKTTQPLHDHFGVGYFTYHRIDNEGRYTVLVDRPDWAEHYVNEQIFIQDPYLRHPDVYQSGLSLMEDHGSPEYKATLAKEGKKVLNMDTAVILIQKSLDAVEFFGFTGNEKTCCLKSLYLNHPLILQSFAQHFKNVFGSILAGMSEEADTLLHLKGEDFLNQEAIHPKINHETVLAYLKDLGLGHLVEKSKLLSPREKECLNLLLDGKTAKESAGILSLSHRTIESYFENIKNKFQCWSKQELLEIAKNLKSIGLL